MSAAKAQPRPRPVAEYKVEAAESRFGTAQPRIAVEVPVGRAGHRTWHAAVYTLAAAVELASEGERWTVNVDLDLAAVAIELADGDEAEAACALAVLHSVAAQGGGR